MKLIYEGKTSRCYRQEIEFPDGFDITLTKNHCNQEKVIQKGNGNHHSAIQQVIEDWGLLPEDQKILLIFDNFKGQKTPTYLQVLEEKNFVYVFVPANLTDQY